MKIFFVLLFAGLVGGMVREAAPPGRYKNMTVLHDGALELEDNNLESWTDSDFVEVYLAEYVIQRMALSSWLRFSTSHMAVVFQNPRKRKWFLVDSFAKSAETIANIVMPSIAPDSPFNFMSFTERMLAYWRGDIVDYLTWDNAAYVRTHEDKSDEFQDMKHVGTIRGEDVKNLREWIVEDYAVQNETHPFTFDMWQIYNASTNERIRKSRMCHDFIEEVLGRLNFIENTDPVYGQYSADLEEKISVFRDSLNLNITEWHEVDITNPKIRRDYQRFLRFFRNHIYEATRDMSFLRVTVTKVITLGIPFIVFLDGNKYVKLTPSLYGVFNYCRMPMDFERGKPYVPAKLDDERQECFLPPYNYNEFQESVRFTFSDYLIAIEQKLDDAVFGTDGQGGDAFHYLVLTIETSVVLFAITRAIKWLANTKFTSI